MTAREIIDRYDEELAWNEHSKLELCLRYIERQQDNDTFKDFIDMQADEEKSFTDS